MNAFSSSGDATVWNVSNSRSSQRRFPQFQGQTSQFLLSSLVRHRDEHFWSRNLQLLQYQIWESLFEFE